MNVQFDRQAFFALLLLLALSSPASAQAHTPSRIAEEVRVAPAEVVLADSWGVGPIGSRSRRTRIVQVCAVLMSIALYIMMRKLN